MIDDNTPVTVGMLKEALQNTRRLLGAGQREIIATLHEAIDALPTRPPSQPASEPTPFDAKKWSERVRKAIVGAATSSTVARILTDEASFLWEAAYARGRDDGALSAKQNFAHTDSTHVAPPATGGKYAEGMADKEPTP